MGPLTGKIEVWGAMFPSFLLLQRAGGLRPPNWGPTGPMIGAIVDQNDCYKNICGLQPVERAHTKNSKKTKFFRPKKI